MTAPADDLELPPALARLALGLTPPFRARCAALARVDIATGVDRLWSILSNLDNGSAWNPQLRDLRLAGVLEAGTVFTCRVRGFTVPSRLREVSVRRRLSWQSHPPGGRALVAWEIEEHAGGVRVTAAQALDGWLPELLPGLLQRRLERSLADTLKALRDAVEHAVGRQASGEIA